MCDFREFSVMSDVIVRPFFFFLEVLKVYDTHKEQEIFEGPRIKPGRKSWNERGSEGNGWYKIGSPRDSQ